VIVVVVRLFVAIPPLPRPFFQLPQNLLEAFRDPVVRNVPDDPQVDLREVPHVSNGRGRKLDRLEDLGNLRRRTVPIFRRKGVEGEDSDGVVTSVGATISIWRLVSLLLSLFLFLVFLDKGPDEINEAAGALEVSSSTGKIPLGGPAPVAVANQSNMPGNLSVLLQFDFIGTLLLLFGCRAVVVGFAFFRRIRYSFSCRSSNRR